VKHLAASGVDVANPVRLEAQVISDPLRAAYGLQFDGAVTRVEMHGQLQPATGKVRLRLPAPDDAELSAAVGSLDLQYGDSIRAFVQLRRPRVYQNPGSFNFRRWMESIEDLYWVGTIRRPELIEKLGRPGPSDASVLIEKVRLRLLRGIDNLYLPWSAEGRNGAVLKAVLLGDRSSLDSDTIENFRKTGLYHLLVIAGLHVGLLAMLMGIVLRFLRLSESWRSGLIFLFLLVYALLVEQRAPTLRATLMIFAYLLARLFYRDQPALNAIGLAGLVLLFWRPAWLFESGFQLSFSAALLIAGLAVPILERTTEPYRRALWQLEAVDLDPALEPRQAQFRLDLRSIIRRLTKRFSVLERHRRIATAMVTVPTRCAIWIANVLLFSTVLQLGLLLPMVETFHRVTFAGIGLNALAVPVMTALLALSVPTVIFSAISPALAVWPGKALALIMTGLFSLTELPSLPGWLSYRVPDPPRWVAGGFLISAVVAAWSLKRRMRLFWASVGAFGLFAGLLSWHPFPPRLPRGVLEVTALDCGGGEAIFIVLPDRTTVLWGTGTSPRRLRREDHGRRGSPGEDIVSPYLWSRGIERLDVLVLASGHDNFSRDLTSLSRNFRIGEFWHGAIQNTEGYDALLEQARETGAYLGLVSAAEGTTRGEASIQILWPPAHSSSSPLLDEGSIVMRIRYRGANVLLSADIGGKAQRELVSSTLPLESQIVNIRRQSLRSASGVQFFRRVSPRIALLTGESGSRTTALPPAALERFRITGAQILRTDIEGAVTLELKGSSIAIHRYRASPAE
jgi:competence protein ComEC